MADAGLELIGGPKKVPIILVEYDEQWPARFERHRAVIATALGAAALRIEHVGSTSVQGLTAKPVVDILLVVARSADEPAYLPALQAAGYVLRVREPGWQEHRMLRTPQRDVHLHVLSTGAPEIERLLVFRDLLRRDLAARRLYADTKQRLATRDWPTMQHYADAKTDVVEALLRRAAATAGASP